MASVEPGVSESNGAESVEKNEQNIVCPFGKCKSVILRPNTAEKVKNKFPLPVCKRKKKKKDKKKAEGAEGAEAVVSAEEEITDEEIEDYWKVRDLFTFENVGFSNTKDGVKYLICADCERGPIGYQLVDDPKNIYVACSRVEYSK